MSDFKCKFEGLILSTDTGLLITWDAHNIVRLLMFLMGLGYTFLGVAVISDVFMAGIEKITSSTKHVTDKKTGKTMTVYVWNATVANLTLMALGSSAPEILLSIIEITTGDFFLGPLGAGTIVGSAAFNLLCISAVCVCAIPDGDVRFIKEVPVYIITASFSVFAYLWLMFILLVTSPDVTETWEAVVTLLFCPLFVFLAFLADRGYLLACCAMKGGGEEEAVTEKKQTLDDRATDEELLEIVANIREKYGQSLTEDQVVTIMKEEFFNTHSRAYYRHEGMKHMLLGDHSELIPERSRTSVIQEALGTSDDVSAEKALKTVAVGFACDKYKWPEAIGKGKITIMRLGAKDVKVTVKYATQSGAAGPGTATADKDYKAVDTSLTFEKGEKEKDIFIEIINDDEVERSETFSVILKEATCEETGYTAKVAEKAKETTITIEDDDFPGNLRFQTENDVVHETPNDQVHKVMVHRVEGSKGWLQCQYKLQGGTAAEGTDFEAAEGSVLFERGQLTQTVLVTIKAKARTDSVAFDVKLTDIKSEHEGAKFAPEKEGDAFSCVCHVQIDHQSQEHMLQVMRKNIHAANTMGHHAHTEGDAPAGLCADWAQQFKDAIWGEAEEEEEGEGGEPGEPKEGSSKADLFIHVITIPWKVLFAFTPPADCGGGWPCFFGALFFIGLVTALVGDMANLVGCCFDVLPETAAITFVALGTSLPDTFASKTAAIVDPYADASIGNVTGSNSVNVFLGVGIAWAVAAFYWQTSDLAGNTAYAKAFLTLDADQQKNVKDAIDGGDKAVFMTPGGTLWFNLMVFSVNAGFALQHLFARRKKWGGELGGPKKGFMGQYFSAAFLIFQWFIYVGASIAFARSGDGAVTYGMLTAPEVTTPAPTTR